MTNERAKSELEQLYMSLSEEKKKALDVAFKAMEQADTIPVMHYPQVDGITPTVVAQADGEKTCGTCRNEDTYHCAECENKSDYEQSQADGEYILKSEAIRVASGYCHPSNIAKELRKLPSVAIPSAEPKTEWIPVSERLPEYMVSVLTWDGGAICIEKRIPYILDDNGEPIESDWWVNDEYEDGSEYYPNLRDGAAIAWMPLPTSYEPRKGANE